ncbi:ricin B-like lectin [Cutaneotrichosporon oleaginosum]|uniref:Ricin B-like lectin n=1 Tax=Cutaneotrichosporon oleaginosum TaxID=879819 RepID=A0A0J0XP69_9TREE|nr:ricin B-like lectin [Cutaneotrichosporon oleaginosum]KLT42877.1 ricin B-like lectin [Cutaneotrichosporon oleaginosum]TXT12582.1 hypothetical protein COLE_02992 [Cutaneotrichosporon oleaginosum]
MLYLAFALALLTPALAATIESVSVPGVCLEHLLVNDQHTLVVEGCYDRPEYQFELVRGATRVKWQGGDLCLDAGNAPANGQLLTFQPCNRRAPGQAWWLTDDGRIALQDQGFCVDLPAGTGENQDAVQIWRCGDGNINQAWVVGGAGASA